MGGVSLTAGIGILKTAFDIAKGLKDIDDATRRNAAVIELQEKILDAQTTQAGLIEYVRSLEEEVASFEKWDAEKERYELKALRPSVFAYMLKPNTRGAEPPHWVCANCYGNRKISLFQWTAHMAQAYRLVQCPACKNEIAPGAEPHWL
jgi:hypothetical protein